jgi:hypothetical protein
MAENLSSSLNTLINKADDPRLLDYVIQHLGTDVPADLRPNAYQASAATRKLASDRKPAVLADAQMRAQMRAHLRQQRAMVTAVLSLQSLRASVAGAERQGFVSALRSAAGAVRGELQAQQELQTRLEADATLRARRENWRELLRGDDAALAARLRAKDAAARLEAVSAVVLRRARVEGDLIPLLNDGDAEVRKAAHNALVLLARGTDFGPAANVERVDRLRARARWEGWWAEQDGNPRTVAATAAAAAAGRGAPAAGGAAQPAATPEGDVRTFVLETVGEQANRFGAALAAAKGPERQAVIDNYRQRKGGVYSDALVAAIALVEAAERGPVREALSDRLARMTPSTLKARLADEEPEYRVAAARALARRAERAAVPWLIPLLDDPEPAVVQAAHRALKR